jgi:hypothetical protein
MKKFRCYISLDKEEEWLNEMVNHGWELCVKHTSYEFRREGLFGWLSLV